MAINNIWGSFVNLVKSSLSDHQKALAIKELYPDKFQEWLRTSYYDNDGIRTDKSTPIVGGLNYAQSYIIDSTTGLGKLPDGTYVDPSSGQIATAPPVTTALPPGTFEIVKGSGAFTDGSGNWYDKTGNKMSVSQANTMMSAYTTSKNNGDTNTTVTPDPFPTTQPPAGYHWEMGNDGKWYAAYGGSQLPTSTAPPPFPTEAAPSGYHWQFDSSSNAYVLEAGNIGGTVTNDPFPTTPPPSGYHWELDNSTGKYFPSIGSASTTVTNEQFPTTPAPAGYHWELDSKTGKYYPSIGAANTNPNGMTDYEKARLAQDQAQTLAQMAAQPQSWLQYAALSGQPAVVQPWMVPLSSGDYPQLQTGQQLSNWTGGLQGGQGTQGATSQPGGTGQTPYTPPVNTPVQSPVSQPGSQPATNQPASNTSDGTLVYGDGNWWVWKGGRTILLNQYNGEAIAAGQPTISQPADPSTFDYSKVGINAPTYNAPGYTPPATQVAPQSNPLAGIDPWAVFPYGVGGGAAGGYTTEQVNAAYAMLTAANDPNRPDIRSPEEKAAYAYAMSPGQINGYPTFDVNTPIGGASTTGSQYAYTAPVAQSQVSNWQGAANSATQGMQATPIYQPTQTPMSYSNLPNLLRPSAQYNARMGPTAQAQYQGYEQARTGATPAETQFRLWSMAPPSGQSGSLTYRR